MKPFKILEALDVECPFSEVFSEVENPDDLVPRYRREIGYLRADYDGWCWWNTAWPVHKELASQENVNEIDAVYGALISDSALKDLEALQSYCWNHSDARANSSTTDEFNFYLEGVLNWYWIRLITRRGDYNMYLHAFVKEADAGVQRYFDALDREAEPTGEALQAACPELTEEAAAAIVRRWKRRFCRPVEESTQ